MKFFPYIAEISNLLKNTTAWLTLSEYVALLLIVSVIDHDFVYGDNINKGLSHDSCKKTNS